MAININKYTKTIKGRTTLLIGSFLFILLSFSLYVYVQASIINNDYKLFRNKWHTIQVNFIAQPISLVLLQSNILEAIYEKKVDTVGFNTNRLNDLNSMHTSYYMHLDSCDTDWNYRPVIEDLKLTINNLHFSKQKISNRILFLKSINEEAKIASDSLIIAEYNLSIRGNITHFWTNIFGSTLAKIGENAGNVSERITDRISNLVIIVIVFTVFLSIFYVYLWIKFIKSLKNSISSPIKILEKLAEGELITNAEHTENELSSVVDATLKLSINLKKLVIFN